MLTIGTRFFGANPEKDLPRLDKFLHAAKQIGPTFVAVNANEDKVDSLGFSKANHPDVDAFAVTPWGKFVPPLNAIVYSAMRSGGTQLLTASAEFAPAEDQVNALLRHMQDDTLVSGARFSEHQWSEGEVVGSGVTVPWNTFAIWNLPLLIEICGGFNPVGDAPFDRKQAGVEEVATIAFCQKASPGLKAKLVSIPGFYQEWNTAGWDEDRLKKHQAKIASKVSRPAAQLAWAGLPAPTILHITPPAQGGKDYTFGDLIEDLEGAPRSIRKEAIKRFTGGEDGFFRPSRS